ncbi:hypothetical protein GLOTRDRAFT_126688 [Gloeophyllum trabeum ATCC 11539]|uniref:Uncharacterized protein n=1 Tax=Gloeophyllum trabeum (strain ATCC 11539 / FP-39264 / Madison 617) TaxID=670483 RepID=S7QFJ9_GLOTA|nr:uncharacterized protein GLOTRDRAFT_126688 [Gloeophyllum trabeum ATCC 11539]EPQ58197.1 hypothetical protein GLOTRDRAFT_126688 [Gloeophyllum trabeum ATCC 11539]
MASDSDGVPTSDTSSSSNPVSSDSTPAANTSDETADIDPADFIQEELQSFAELVDELVQGAVSNDFNLPEATPPRTAAPAAEPASIPRNEVWLLRNLFLYSSGTETFQTLTELWSRGQDNLDLELQYQEVMNA